MYTINIRRFKEKGNFLPSNAYWHTTKVYTEQEAKDAGLDYAYWRKHTDQKWLLTDDDTVLEVLKKVPLGKQHIITVPRARIITNQTKPFLFNINWRDENLKGELRQKRTRIAVTLYTRMFLKRKAINWDLLGQALRPTVANPRKFAQIFFHKKEVKQMVRKEIADAMIQNKLTPERIGEEYNKLIELCKAKSDRENFRLTLERLTDLLDMMPEKKTFNTNMNLNMGSAELPAGTMEALGDADEQMRLAMEVKNGSIEVIKP